MIARARAEEGVVVLSRARYRRAEFGLSPEKLARDTEQLELALQALESDQAERDSALRKVQQKSRWTIDQKYVGREIWIAFPFAGDWYLIPHDMMVASADAATQTASWTGCRMRAVSVCADLRGGR
jgi:hypothetical protein